MSDVYTQDESRGIRNRRGFQTLTGILRQEIPTLKNGSSKKEIPNYFDSKDLRLKTPFNLRKNIAQKLLSSRNNSKLVLTRNIFESKSQNDVFPASKNAQLQKGIHVFEL